MLCCPPVTPPDTCLLPGSTPLSSTCHQSEHGTHDQRDFACLPLVFLAVVSRARTTLVQLATVLICCHGGWKIPVHLCPLAQINPRNSHGFLCLANSHPRNAYSQAPGSIHRSPLGCPASQVPTSCTPAMQTSSPFVSEALHLQFLSGMFFFILAFPSWASPRATSSDSHLASV